MVSEKERVDPHLTLLDWCLSVVCLFWIEHTQTPKDSCVGLGAILQSGDMLTVTSTSVWTDLFLSSLALDKVRPQWSLEVEAGHYIVVATVGDRNVVSG